MAAVPLIAAAGLGVSGFMGYKTIQLISGGKATVAFPSVDGKISPPQPLPDEKRIAVWPGYTGEIQFAEALTKSGKFDVTSPAKVSVILQNAKKSDALTQLTESEQIDAFNDICSAIGGGIVFAKHDLGVSMKGNYLSFSRTNSTYRFNLLGFSCTRKAIVWREQMALIVEVGSNSVPLGELYKLTGESWAERVISSPRV